MFFNRTGFNRMGPNLLAEANIKSISYSKADSNMLAGSDAQLSAKGSIYGKTFTACFAEAGIKSAGCLEGQIYRPVYGAASILSQAMMRSGAFRHYDGEGIMTGKAKLSATLYTIILVEGYGAGRSSIYARAFKGYKGEIRFSSQAHLQAYAGAVRYFGAGMEGDSYYTAAAASYDVEILQIEDIQFDPGDTIEIDLCNFYITHNGASIMDKVNGGFFRLYPGANYILWRDNAQERDIEMKTRYQNKYL